MPPAHVAYLREQLAADRPRLGLALVPHVLAAGPVDIAGLPLEPLA